MTLQFENLNREFLELSKRMTEREGVVVNQELRIEKLKTELNNSQSETIKQTESQVLREREYEKVLEVKNLEIE